MIRVVTQRAAIQRITKALSSGLPARDMQHMIVEEALRLTDASSAVYCLLDAEQDQLIYSAASGENAQEMTGLRVRISDSLSDAVITSKKTQIMDGRDIAGTGNLFTVSSTYRHESSLSTFPRSKLANRSAAIVPVFQTDSRAGRGSNDLIVGTLSALNKRESPAQKQDPAFDTDDIAILELLADFISLSNSIELTYGLAKDHQRELSVLYDSIRTISGSLNVRDVLTGVLDSLCNHLEYYSAVIFLLNDERTHLYIADARGLSADEMDHQLAVDSGLHAYALDSGLPRLISDTDQYNNFQDISEKTHSLSAMIAPIKSRQETHGLLFVTSLQRNAYTASDLRLISTVANQAGVAFDNACIHEESLRQNEQQSALYELSQRLNAALHLEAALDIIGDSVQNLLNVEMVALYLFEREEGRGKREEGNSEGRLIPKMSRGLDPPLFAQDQPKLGEGISGWVQQWQTPQAITDITTDARNRPSQPVLESSAVPLEHYGVASTLCIPIQLGEEVLGVIHAMTSHRRLFTVSEMELLYTIANQAAVAIVNAMNHKDARARAHMVSRYFRRVARAIGSSLEVQDVPQMFANVACEIMRADRCALYRIENGELILRAASRFAATIPPAESIPAGHVLAGSVAKRGQPIVITDLRDDERVAGQDWIKRDKLASYLAIPLKSKRKTVGVVEIYTVDRREFLSEEIQLFSTFAKRANVAEKLAHEVSIA